jgi:type IV secretion system protein VirD4
LGAPWFRLFGFPSTAAFFWWWYGYDAYAPRSSSGAYIAASGGFIAVAVAIGMSVWRAREAKKVETYGSARWAETEEVKARACSAPMASCSAATTALSSP